MDSISDKVKKIRVEYEDKPLNIEDLDTNPLEQFNVWFQIAIDAEVIEANAMAISTISEEGTPRSRYVQTACTKRSSSSRSPSEQTWM